MLIKPKLAFQKETFLFLFGEGSEKQHDTSVSFVNSWCNKNHRNWINWHQHQDNIKAARSNLTSKEQLAPPNCFYEVLWNQEIGSEAPAKLDTTSLSFFFLLAIMKKVLKFQTSHYDQWKIQNQSDDTVQGVQDKPSSEKNIFM